MLRIGDMVGERYRIDGELGRGGFATVYSAWELALQRPVALKVLHPGPDGTYAPEATARFHRELRSLGELRSPHTVRLLNSGTTSEGLHFAVFEQLEGKDLGSVIGERGALRPAEAMRILEQLLESLAEAHHRGILHRDLKPENVIVTHVGSELSVKLIDFGIARRLDRGSPSITATGELIGTPRYMSPEQLTDKPLTAASDLYSLGMIGIEMCLGREALQGGAWGDQLDRLRTGYVFPVGHGEGLPHRLREVLERLTARDPGDRYPNADAALAALQGQREPAKFHREPPSPNREAPQRAYFVAGVGLTVVVALLVVSLWPSEEPQPPLPSVTLPAPAVSRPQVKPPQPARTPKSGGECDVERLPFVADEVTRRVEIANDLSSRIPAHWVLPSTIDLAAPVTLLIMVHERGVDPAELASKSGFAKLAVEHGFAFAVPELPIERGIRHGESAEVLNLDGATARVQALHDWASTKLCLGKVLLVTLGSAGEVGDRLMCMPWLSGLAMNARMSPHPATLAEYCSVQPRRVPTIWLYPTDSKHHPQETGDLSCRGKAYTGPSLSKLEEQWIREHGCGDIEEIAHGTSVCRRPVDCEVPMQLCMIDGGHPWPGMPSRPIDDCDGVAPNFDSAGLVWKFFEEHVLDD